MSKGNLKFLNWTALLNDSSDDDRDSDETMCEELGVDDAVIAKSSEANGTIADKPNVESRIVLKNVEMPGILSKNTVLSTEEYNSNTGHILLSDNNVSDLKNHNNFCDYSEDTFGFTDMTNNCIERLECESNIKLGLKQCPEEKENCFNGSCKERRFSIESYVVEKPDDVKQPSCYQSPFGLRNEQIESPTSNNVQNDCQFNKNDMFNIILSNFSQARDLPSQTNNVNEEGTLNTIRKDGLNKAHVDFQSPCTGILTNCENETLIKEIEDNFALSCNEIQLGTDNDSLQTDNCFFGISTESLLENIGSDFLQETFEQTDDLRRKTCSPPLTLTEKPLKRNIVSEKIIPQSRKRNKSTIPEKILPGRTCQSKYINRSKRSSESEESTEPNHASFDWNNVSIIQAREEETTNVSYKTNKTKKNSIGKISSNKLKPKAIPGSKSVQEKETVKVPFVQKLKQMERALLRVEEDTHNWVNGVEEHFVTREKAFEMLMKAQSIVKSLESLNVPKRCGRRFTEIKDKLCNRAKKLAFAIDAAIAESDQMFKREFYEKLSGEKSIDNNEEIAEEIEETVGSAFIEGSTPKVTPEKSTSNKTNQRELPNKLKSIIKTSSSEGSAENSVTGRKHISFSDEIEFRYLSGSSLSSSCSGQSQHRSESDANITKSDSTENKECNGKSTSETHNVQEPLAVNVESDGPTCSTSKNTAYDIQVMEFTDVAKQKIMSSVTELEKIKSAENYNELYPTSSSYSESSTEGYSFSKDSSKTKQRIWEDVSIMDIKYIRIKSPDEFIPADQDTDTWLDLDKW